MSEERVLELKKSIKRGLSSDEAIEKLKNLRFSLIEAIKFVRTEYGIDLGEAKRMVSAHKSYFSEVEENQSLHDTLENSLKD